MIAVRKAGGLTIAQDGSATFSGMPDGAIESKAVQFDPQPGGNVGGDSRLAGASRVQPPAVSFEATETALIGRIFTALASQRQIDFRSISRLRSNAGSPVECKVAGPPPLEGYVTILENEPDEQERLFREFLISVTRYRRDESTWRRWSP
ncbi:MAG: hypothetical protein R3E96_12460 [Planctomycetota bacterium]